MIVALAAYAINQTSPELVAVQETKDSAPIRAWTGHGKPLHDLIPLTWGDVEQLKGARALEIIVKGSSRPGEAFPSAIWSQPHGAKIVTWTSSWKDDEPKTCVWYCGLVVVPQAKQADITLRVSVGKFKSIVLPTPLQKDKWTTLSGGFRARVKNKFFDDNDQPHVLHGMLSVDIPQGYRTWDIEPEVKVNDLADDNVATNQVNGRLEFKLENPVLKPITVSINVRPYKSFRYAHIALNPR